MKMIPIAAFFLGAGYVYLLENPEASRKLAAQFRKLSGAAIDRLDRQGEQDAPEPPQEPEA